MKLFSLLATLSTTPIVSLLASPTHHHQVPSADVYRVTSKHHGGRAELIGRHRDISQVRRQAMPYKDVFWAFGEDGPKTNDLPAVKDVLEIVAAGDKHMDQPTTTTVSSAPTATRSIYGSTLPTLHLAPPTISFHNSILIGTLSASAPTPTSSVSVINTQNASGPEEDASRKHKIISVIVIAGSIISLILLVGILRVINGSNLWFMRRKALASDTEAGVKNGKNVWDWQRLSNPPKNFGTKPLLLPKKMEEDTLRRRQYDERGVERGSPEPMEDKVVIIQPQSKLIQLDTPHQSLIPKPPVKEATLVFPPALAATVGSLVSTPASGPVLSVSSSEIDIQYPNPISLPASSSHVSGSTTFSTLTRTKSAPAVPTSGDQSRHASTQRSRLSSEWDIAGAYGGTRSEKSRSTGAMSGLSIDSKEWQYRQKMRASGRSSGRTSGRVVSG